MSDSVKTRAVVLRRTNYGEADRILSLLTPEGKMGVMAKGVRKERSKLAGGIELFCLSEVMVHRGRGELGVLTGARLVEFFGEIMKSLPAMEMVGGMLKEVGRRAEQVDSEEYFDMSVQVMREVNGLLKVGEMGKLPVVQTWWRLNMLRVGGEEVNLYTDDKGEKLRAEGRYVWDSVGQVFCENDGGEMGAEHIKLMRLMVSSELGVALRVRGAEEMCVRLRFDEC